MTKSTISIKRESVFADKLRNYRVVLDGVIIGDIADGEKKNFDIDPGTHTLRMKIDWAGSNRVTFDASKNKTIHFKCAGNIVGSKRLLAIVYALFLFNRWVELKRID